MAKTNPARGMRDFLPADVRKREYVIKIIKEVYESYGFEPLETPAVENLETLLGKYGEEGNQLIFRILKRGEKLDLQNATSENDLADLALRYDLTVPLARVVSHYRDKLPKFLKRYQIQPVWRADRPARGRFREFFQCDVDWIGSRSAVIEAELISAVTDVLRRLGFNDFWVRINHRDLLLTLLGGFGICPELLDPAVIVVDKLDKIGPAAVAGELKALGVEKAESLVSIIQKTTSSVEELRKDFGSGPVPDAALENLEAIISLANCPAVIIDPSLARGLSYYTGAIFEINVPDLAGSLGGGGRYDGLIGMFSKEQIPACGFSLGLERILVVMEERRMFPPEIETASPADVLVTLFSSETIRESLKIAAELRTAGIRVTVYPEPDKIGKQLRYADQINIPIVVLVGESELQEDSVSIKNLVQSGQKSVGRKNLIKEIKAMLPTR
ncbi:MAG: histidine--tRNA ligase [Blastocatellia bacterium]